MTTPNDQFFESYLPVYDTVPKEWEDARIIFVEYFKKISNAVNAREIGFFLDEEVLSGKSFIPGVTIPGNNPGIFRSILRKVVDAGPITVGVNIIPHGITFDSNFKLIQLWASATKIGISATTFSNSDTLSMVPVNFVLTSDNNYDSCFVFCEYIQEL